MNSTDEFDGQLRRRFYVNAAEHAPTIQPVHPGEPNYPFAALSLDFAKIHARDVIRNRIGNLRSTLKSLDQLTVQDVDRQETPSPWPPVRGDHP